MIHKGLCWRVDFDHYEKWYIHKLEYILENKTRKFLWDFEIKTNYKIQIGRFYLVLIKKKISVQSLKFTVPVDPRVKIKASGKKDKYLDLTLQSKSC